MRNATNHSLPDVEIIKSVETRRRALYKYYQLPPAAARKAEALFTRMELFGKECSNLAEFEKKMVTQTLNSEYLDLFVEFTAYVKLPDPEL